MRGAGAIGSLTRNLPEIAAPRVGYLRAHAGNRPNGKLCLKGMVIGVAEVRFINGRVGLRIGLDKVFRRVLSKDRPGEASERAPLGIRLSAGGESTISYEQAIDSQSVQRAGQCLIVSIRESARGRRGCS